MTSINQNPQFNQTTLSASDVARLSGIRAKNATDFVAQIDATLDLANRHTAGCLSV